VVFLLNVGAGVRNDMPRIVAAKSRQHSANKDLTAKDAKLAKNFKDSLPYSFAFFAAFAVRVLAEC